MKGKKKKTIKKESIKVKQSTEKEVKMQGPGLTWAGPQASPGVLSLEEAPPRASARMWLARRFPYLQPKMLLVELTANLGSHYTPCVQNPIFTNTTAHCNVFFLLLIK